MPEHSLLAADIGGTNVRLGAYQGDRLMARAQFSTKRDGALLDLISGFAAEMDLPPEVVVVAAAGPVADNRVELTNAKQSLCGAELRAATGASEAQIINDFAAAAWASLSPAPEDLVTLQGASTPPEGTRLVIGPGTGLGVGALARVGNSYASVPGEGGHIGISPRSRAEVEVFEALKPIWPEIFYGDALAIEAEGMLSGTGLPYLYRAVQSVRGGGSDAPDAAEIMQRAKSATDPIAVEVISMFKSHLAQVAGDLCLAFGAEGGVFLVGGVAMKNAWLFDEDFLSAFRAGGRFTEERANRSLYLLNVENFGLLGAQTYAKQLTK